MIFVIIHIMTNNKKNFYAHRLCFFEFRNRVWLYAKHSNINFWSLLLHVFVKPSNLYQRGPSYWKLKEKILKNNASLISEDLKNFSENESPSSYENFKHNFRDLLKFIQQNKKRVDQKELNILKYHKNVLRDCIHSGKGPDTRVWLKKMISCWNIFKKFPRKKIFQNV